MTNISPEAVTLARRSPFTAEFAQELLGVRERVAPTMTEDAFVSAVLRFGLEPIEALAVAGIQFVGIARDPHTGVLRVTTEVEPVAGRIDFAAG